MKRFLALLLLVVIVAATGAAVLYSRVNQPYRGYSESEQFVDIPQGAGSRGIGERLVDAGVVRDTTTFRLALWMSGQGRHLRAGEYRFDQPMTPFAVIDKMVRGDVFVIAITFPEGHTSAEMAKVFAGHGLGSAAAFVEAADDPQPIQALDPGASDLEGYLFPETYSLSRHDNASKLVRLMTNRFTEVFSSDMRAAAAAHNLTVRAAVTLASIVEKETGKPEERPIVAAVYLNRLKIGMALQCDPTVIYALELTGRYNGNLRRQDLAVDSPYNTYRYPGLPPGPIASPGRAALEAATHPADVDYLYFVSRNDGTHAFARTFEEHNRNVQKYQVQYFRDLKAGKAGEAGEAGEAGRAGRAGEAARGRGPGTARRVAKVRR